MASTPPGTPSVAGTRDSVSGTPSYGYASPLSSLATSPAAGPATAASRLSSRPASMNSLLSNESRSSVSSLLGEDGVLLAEPFASEEALATVQAEMTQVVETVAESQRRARAAAAAVFACSCACLECQGTAPGASPRRRMCHCEEAMIADCLRIDPSRDADVGNVRSLLLLQSTVVRRLIKAHDFFNAYSLLSSITTGIEVALPSLIRTQDVMHEVEPLLMHTWSSFASHASRLPVKLVATAFEYLDQVDAMLQHTVQVALWSLTRAYARTRSAAQLRQTLDRYVAKLQGPRDERMRLTYACVALERNLLPEAYAVALVGLRASDRIDAKHARGLRFPSATPPQSAQATLERVERRASTDSLLGQTSLPRPPCQPAGTNVAVRCTRAHFANLITGTVSHQTPCLQYAAFLARLVVLRPSLSACCATSPGAARVGAGAGGMSSGPLMLRTRIPALAMLAGLSLAHQLTLDVSSPALRCYAFSQESRLLMRPVLQREVVAALSLLALLDGIPPSQANEAMHVVAELQEAGDTTCATMLRVLLAFARAPSPATFRPVMRAARAFQMTQHIWASIGPSVLLYCRNEIADDEMQATLHVVVRAALSSPSALFTVMSGVLTGLDRYLGRSAVSPEYASLVLWLLEVYGSHSAVLQPLARDLLRHVERCSKYWPKASKKAARRSVARLSSAHAPDPRPRSSRSRDRAASVALPAGVYASPVGTPVTSPRHSRLSAALRRKSTDVLTPRRAAPPQM